MTTIRDIQVELAARGFDSGPVDGVIGPRTRKAIMAYQRARGLTVDGIVGPVTRSALFGASAAKPEPAKAVPTEMPWLVEAERLRGLREAPGAASNPIIDDWADDLHVAYADDSVAWCGLFVGHCMRTGLPDADLPGGLLSARAWVSFGDEVRPQLGAVLVFWRDSPGGWKGHVGFYWAEDATHYHVLGGNQSDSVSVTRVAKTRRLGSRWPDDVDAPAIIRTASPVGALISVNEA